MLFKTITRKSKIIPLSAGVVFGMCVMGCKAETVEILNDVEPYSSMMNQAYELVVDSYVVVWTESKKNEQYLTPGNIPRYRLPEPVSSSHIGEEIKKQKIVGVVKAGTSFEIVNIRHIKSFEYDYVHYDVELLGRMRQPWGRLNAYRLMDQYQAVPSIKKEFATRVDPPE